MNGTHVNEGTELGGSYTMISLDSACFQLVLIGKEKMEGAQNGNKISREKRSSI
jgi:hypothetical protein